LNRRFSASLLLMTMSVLAAVSGTGHGLPAWWAGIPAWLSALLLWPQLGGMQKRQALLLIGLGLTATGFAVLRGGHPAWIKLLTQNTALLGMLAAITFLQLLGTPEEEKTELPRGKAALWQTAFGVHLLGAVINLSAVFIMAERIGKDSRPDIEQATLLSRAFLAAALWSPFFAATAVAQAYAPGASPFVLVTAGIMLACVLICLAVRNIVRSNPEHVVEFVGYPMRPSALRFPVLLASLVGLGHWLVPKWSILSVISIAALAVVSIASTLRHGPIHAIRNIARHAGQRLPGMGGELALFLAAGCFANGLTSLIDTGIVWLPFTEFGAFEASVVLALMILLAAFGIHTVISITMAATWLAPLHPDPTLLALVFVQSWAIGLAAGPTSGVNLSIQGRYLIPSTALAKKNLAYCAQAYCAAVLSLAIICYWRGL